MSFPLCVVQMELAAQLEIRSAHLELRWVPRTHNQEADDLTNEACEQFAPELQVAVNLDNIPFRVIPRMMEAGEKFYLEVLEAKKASAGRVIAEPPRNRNTRRRSLRESDPW